MGRSGKERIEIKSNIGKLIPDSGYLNMPNALCLSKRYIGNGLRWAFVYTYVDYVLDMYSCGLCSLRESLSCCRVGQNGPVVELIARRMIKKNVHI